MTIALKENGSPSMERKRILDSELLFLELGDSCDIRCGPARLFLDQAIETGVSGFRAVNMAGFHQRLSIVDCDSE